MTKSILITGAAGYIGRILMRELEERYPIVGFDLRADMDATPPIYACDVRDPRLADHMRDHGVTHVVHLASVLKSSGDPQRDYDIDVNGTHNVLKACVQAGVKHLCVTSSGAAYGYHADNPAWLHEDAPLRGNDEFPYAKHKRIVEALLKEYRDQHPELQQLILRPGTVLGAGTENLITNLFKKKRILAIQGSDAPFVFIWDQDVVRIIIEGIAHDRTGIYNLAGDGAVPLRDIAALLHKPTLELPPKILRLLLTLGHAIKLTRYGPEQLKFLQYRPVLSNQKLKQEFGYIPEKSSKETFIFWMEYAQKHGLL